VNKGRDGLRENSVMLMVLPQLRDRVSFRLSLCLTKDAEELENLRKVTKIRRDFYAKRSLKYEDC